MAPESVSHVSPRTVREDRSVEEPQKAFRSMSALQCTLWCAPRTRVEPQYATEKSISYSERALQENN